MILIEFKIRTSLENPNSEKSKSIARGMEERTGISQLEIHRFHNAVLNNNVLRSFNEQRSGEIAWALCKAFLRNEKYIMKVRGQLSLFANQEKVSFNDLLETMRCLYHEIIDEELAAQLKA